jgi:hypothetical protein
MVDRTTSTRYKAVSTGISLNSQIDLTAVTKARNILCLFTSTATGQSQFCFGVGKCKPIFVLISCSEKIQIIFPDALLAMLCLELGLQSITTLLAQLDTMLMCAIHAKLSHQLGLQSITTLLAQLDMT